VSIETRPDRESWWSPCRDVSDPTTDTWAPLVGCGTRAVQLIQARIHLWPPHLANLLWLKKKKKNTHKHEWSTRSIRLSPPISRSLLTLLSSK
jgi:hypothetical protein